MFVQSAAEVVGDIIFAVRKRTGAAETAHDGTGLAVDTCLHLFAVDRTSALCEAVACFKYRRLEARIELLQLIGRKNPSGTRADNDNIVMFHHETSLFFCFHPLQTKISFIHD